MAYYAVYPSRDATIYEKHERRNTGIDQILELTKIVPNTPDPDGTYWEGVYNSRMLIEFDVNSLSSLISAGTISTSAKYFLSIKATEATDLPIDYTLQVHAVSQSWANGQGHYNDYPEIREGVSWQYRDGYYQGDGQLWISGSLASGTTGSYASVAGGGTWYTGSLYSSSETYNYPVTPDIRINVTDIVKQWISGSIPNNGFIIKRTDADEASTTHLGSVKFFSKDTHTIYIPKLEAVWDDSVLTGTGSLSEVGEEYTVYYKNIKNTYKGSSIEKFRVVARDKYPPQTFSTSSNYSTIKRLPTSSFYAIQDSVTEDFIVPFDSGSTRLSVDSSGNYFRLNMKAFLPERYYRIMLKVQQDGGQVERMIDEGVYFKVDR